MLIPFVAVGVIIEIFLIDSEFALVFAVFVIILTILTIHKIKKVTDVYFKAKKTYGAINSLFREKVTGLKTIKAYEKEFFEKEKFDDAITESYDRSLKFQLNQYYISPMFLLIFDLFVVGLLVYLFDFSANPNTFITNHPIFISQFSDMIIIIQYLLYFASTLLVLPDVIEIWPRAYATSIRIEEVLVLEDEIIENKTKTLKSDFKGIEFRNVSFKDRNQDIIRNVSFKIPDKSTVAIVGPYSSGKTVLMNLLDGLYEADEGEILLDGFDINDFNLKIDSLDLVSITGQIGSGKSTLVGLLVGLYSVDSGEILLDGRNIYEIDSNSYRNILGYVSSQKWIFEGTIAENIGYGIAEYDTDDIKKVCELIGFDEIVEKMPDKYDTKISDEKNKISDSERGMICIARALIRNPKILILDEVTVDITDILDEMTVFIITDDESIINRSDKVIDLGESDE